MSMGGLILIHLLLTGGFFILDARTHGRIQAFADAWIVFFLPGFGLAILLLFRFFCWILRLKKGNAPEFSAPCEPLFRGTEFGKEIIPLNDAFLVEDRRQRQRFFTEAIKQSVVENQNILQMAMHDRDREIAYYAVSMLTTRMEKLETKLFQKESEIDVDSSQNRDGLEEYASLLREYLAQKPFVDPVTWGKKQGDYIDLLNRLIQLEPDRMEYYEEEIRQLLSIRNFRAAGQLCGAMMERFPDREESFLMAIELCQAERDPEKLQQQIRALKASPIHLSKRALDVLRFWDEGARSNE